MVVSQLDCDLTAMVKKNIGQSNAAKKSFIVVVFFTIYSVPWSNLSGIAYLVSDSKNFLFQ